jgi:hypothetical protein
MTLKSPSCFGSCIAAEAFQENKLINTSLVSPLMRRAWPCGRTARTCKLCINRLALLGWMLTHIVAQAEPFLPVTQCELSLAKIRCLSHVLEMMW